MFQSDSVSDFMYDAANDMAAGPVEEGDAPLVWEGLRDLVANLELDGVDTDALYDDFEPPTGAGTHVAIVVGNLWDNEGFIGVVPEAALGDTIRADLQACNGNIYDDQREDTDYSTFAAALRLAAACGAHGSLEAFTESYRVHATHWADVEAFASASFGCLLAYSVYRDGALDGELMRKPLSASYAAMLGTG